MSYTPSKMVLLSSQTASNSASISFTSLITSSYQTYFVTFRSILPASGSPQLYMLASTNNGSSYLNSGYQWCFNFTLPSGEGRVASAADSQWVIDDLIGSTANSSFNGDLWLFNFNQASLFPTYMGNFQIWDGSSVFVTIRTGGGFGASNQINAVQFKMSSGNIASGTISLYGVVEP